MENNTITPWTSIATDPDFQKLSPEAQEQSRQTYLNKVVLPEAAKSGIDSNEAKTQFLQSSLKHDHENSIITTPDAVSRMKNYGLDTSNIENQHTATDAGSQLKAFGSGAYKATASMGEGLIETGTTIDKWLGVTSPQAEQQEYSQLNKQQSTREANVSQSEKEHPYFAEAGRFAANALPFAATAPEMGVVKGASALSNIGLNAAKLTATAAPTQAAIANTANPEGKLNEAENTLIATPALTAAGAGAATMLQGGINASKYVVDRFTKAGQDRNVLKNILSTGYGGVNEQTQAALGQDISDAKQQFASSGVTPTTTVLPATKAVAQEAANKTTAVALQQKESEAATQVSNNVQSQFATTPSQEQVVKDTANTAIQSSDKGLRDTANIIGTGPLKQPPSANVSAQEDARLIGATRSLGEERNAAYTQASTEGSKIPVDTEKLTNAISNLDPDVVKQFGVANKKLGLSIDNETNEIDISKTPSLEDLRVAAKSVKQGIDNFYSSGGKDLNFDVEGAQKYYDALQGMRDDLISGASKTNPQMEQILRPDKYAEANYYSYLKGDRPVTPTASPATGLTPKTNNSPDFLENAVGKWNNDRNSGSAKEASQTLETYFDKAGPEGAAAVKALTTIRPGSTTTPSGAHVLGDYFTSKALESGISNGKIDEKALESYLTSRQEAISALPPNIKQKVNSSVQFFIDASKHYKLTGENLAPFANWAMGKESNAIFDGAMHNEKALNALYDKFKSVGNTDGLTSILQSRFLEANKVNTQIPSQLASTKNQFIQVNTLNPKLVGDIVTKSTSEGSLYPVAMKLYGKDFNKVEKAVDNINSLEYNMPNMKPTEGAKESEAVGDLPKLLAYNFGLRYGTIATSSKMFNMLTSKGLGAAQLRVLGDINYAEQLNNSFKSRDYKHIAEVISNFGVPIATAAGELSDKKEQANEKSNTPLSNNINTGTYTATPASNAKQPVVNKPTTVPSNYTEPTQKKSDASTQVGEYQLASLEKKYTLPAGLLTAQRGQESGGEDNPNQATSNKGAKGSFQFMPKTAKAYGIDPTKPDQAAEGAAHYMSDLMDKYDGDLKKALAAYNWGPGNLDDNGLANAPRETKNYVKKIMNAIGR